LGVGFEVGSMPYRIKTWIPVEEEDPVIYKTREEAEKVYEQLRLLQPENIYKIVEISSENTIHGEEPKRNF